MKKPNLAIYYFKNALEKLEANTVNGNVVPPQGGGQETTSWVTQAQVNFYFSIFFRTYKFRLNVVQVLYNIGISLLHARRPQVAFEILLEVTLTSNNFSSQTVIFSIFTGCWCSLLGPGSVVSSRRMLHPASSTQC